MLRRDKNVDWSNVRAKYRTKVMSTRSVLGLRGYKCWLDHLLDL